MLELYHGGPGANSLKALLPLHEKRLEFSSHLLNLLRFEQHDKWRESAAQVWTQAQLDDWRRKVRASIQRMEQGMAGPWMLGKQFTLADVSLFSMLIGMPDRYGDIVNAQDSPCVVEWYAR